MLRFSLHRVECWQLYPLMFQKYSLKLLRRAFPNLRMINPLEVRLLLQHWSLYLVLHWLLKSCKLSFPQPLDWFCSPFSLNLNPQFEGLIPHHRYHPDRLAFPYPPVSLDRTGRILKSLLYW